MSFTSEQMISFETLEINIMKILTRNSGKFMSQYLVYEELIKNMDLKDPSEKNILKYRFLIILRKLSTVYDGISINNNNNILRICFNKTDDTIDDIEDSENNSNKINGSSYTIYTSTEKDSSKLPHEQDVIKFIIDNKLEEYYDKKDYEGNTILHNLIKFNENERIKSILNKYIYLSYIENNNKQTPIDLINNITTSNIFIKHLLLNNLSLKTDLSTYNSQLQNELVQIKKNMHTHNLLLYIYIIIYILTFLAFTPFYISNVDFHDKKI